MFWPNNISYIIYVLYVLYVWYMNTDIYVSVQYGDLRPRNSRTKIKTLNLLSINMFISFHLSVISNLQI